MNTIDKMNLNSKMEESFEWLKWSKEIPFIPMNNDWLIQVIPPFGGAVVRFCVKSKSTGKRVSVYLDCYKMLGSSDNYWEVYDGERYRCDINDVDQLVKLIT